MPKISCAGCLCLSPAISAQFTLEMRVAAQNREKFTKALYSGVQGYSRSSMLPVLVMIMLQWQIAGHFILWVSELNSIKGRCWK